MSWVCEYCQDGEHVLVDGSRDHQDGPEVLLVVDDDPHLSATAYCDGGYISGWGSRAINYCPVCGRRLAGGR